MKNRNFISLNAYARACKTYKLKMVNENCINAFCLDEIYMPDVTAQCRNDAKRRQSDLTLSLSSPAEKCICSMAKTIKLIEIKYTWKNNSIIGLEIFRQPINRRCKIYPSKVCVRRYFILILFNTRNDILWPFPLRPLSLAGLGYRYQNIFNLFN